MLGQVFGELTVVARATAIRKGRLQKKKAAWICLCSCGRKIRVPGFKLRRGESTLCWRGEHRRYRTGGLTVDNPHEYNSWESMRTRCNDKNHHKYPLYGGRGIRVCERWSVFANFLADMGPKPTSKHSIDRKDGNGHYEPSNCRWATSAEQSRNMRHNVYVEWQGQRVLLMDIIPAGLTRMNVYTRLKLGWPLELALSTPLRPKGIKKKKKRRKRPRPLPDAVFPLDVAVPTTLLSDPTEGDPK